MRLMPLSNSWSAVGFKVAGDQAQGAAAGRHRLRRREVLAVDVRHRGRLPIVRVVAETALLFTPGACVHIALIGMSSQLLHLHAIGDEGAAALVRLAVVADAALLERGLHLAVVLVRHQVGDRLAQIPQETVAGLGALDHRPARTGSQGRDHSRAAS